MAFSHSVYLVLSFQPVSSELVISVYQDVIPCEYQNSCCVTILDCCVGILYEKFLSKQFFPFNILLRTIFLVFFCASNFFNDFWYPSNLLMVRPLFHLSRISIQTIHNTARLFQHLMLRVFQFKKLYHRLRSRVSMQIHFKFHFGVLFSSTGILTKIFKICQTEVALNIKKFLHNINCTDYNVKMKIR